MLGLIIAVILFNSVAFITNKRLTKNQIVHTMDIYNNITDWLLICIWVLNIMVIGILIKALNGSDLPAFTLLGAPIIMLFLNWLSSSKLIF